MFHYHSSDGNSSSSSCHRGIDGTASRPDALLASGAAFLPSPSSYILNCGSQGQPPPQLLGLAPSHHHQQVVPPAASFHRVMSTGDLLREEEGEQRAVAPGRYSAEERRERIDKYRSKRNQRNFQKKITYACRKTLADSRPRVKGRFARNGGDYAEAEADAPHAAGIESSSVNVTSNCMIPRSETNVDVVYNEEDSCSSMPEWWPAMREALAKDLDSDLCNATDDEALAAYLGVSSISLYSSSYSPSADE